MRRSGKKEVCGNLMIARKKKTRILSSGMGSPKAVFIEEENCGGGETYRVRN